MDFSKYENKTHFPAHPIKPIISKEDRDNPKGLRAFANAIEVYESSMKIYRTQQDAYQKETSRLYDLFKKDALEEVGLTEHPKANKAFSLAWDDGHSSGYSSVFHYLMKYAELILD